MWRRAATRASLDALCLWLRYNLVFGRHLPRIHSRVFLERRKNSSGGKITAQSMSPVHSRIPTMPCIITPSATAPQGLNLILLVRFPTAVLRFPSLTDSPLDYLTANGPTVKTPLNDTQKSALYAELASGAETGEQGHPLLVITGLIMCCRVGLQHALVPRDGRR